jgi:hypothetical protein
MFARAPVLAVASGGPLESVLNHAAGAGPGNSGGGGGTGFLCANHAEAFAGEEGETSRCRVVPWDGVARCGRGVALRGVAWRGMAWHDVA